MHHRILDWFFAKHTNWSIYKMYLTVCVTCKLFFRILQINTPNTEAFDRVWHDGLLHELHTMSATRPHSSSKNHLIIKQNLQIKISDHTSTEIMIEAGVPQGSRLSSLIYSIISQLPLTCLHLYIFIHWRYNVLFQQHIP